MSHNDLRRNPVDAFQITESHAYALHELPPYGGLQRVQRVVASQAAEKRHPRSPVLWDQWPTLFGRAVRRQTMPVVVERLHEHSMPRRKVADRESGTSARPLGRCVSVGGRAAVSGEHRASPGSSPARHCDPHERGQVLDFGIRFERQPPKDLLNAFRRGAAVRPNLEAKGWDAEGVPTLASVACFAALKSPLLTHYGDGPGMDLYRVISINESTRADTIGALRVVATAANLLVISSDLYEQEFRSAVAGVMTTRDGRPDPVRISGFVNVPEAGD